MAYQDTTNPVIDSDARQNEDEKQAGQPEVSVHLVDLSDPDAHLTDEERKAIDRKLVWKIDLSLIPWLCLLYLLSFLDRANIGNAKIDGLQKSLHSMSTGQYNACLTIFFISYALLEPLTNVLLKKLRPSIFIPIIMVIWGCVMISMGYVENWSGLMAARWFLGVAEAGLFPGISYFLSCWYKREEFGVRAAIFFSAAALAGSFGGLLAAAINNLNGHGGRPGWAWIFIIEGIVTIGIGFLSFFMVHDFPDTATFLSEQNRARVHRRLKEDKQSSAEHEEFKVKYLWAAVSDWKMYLGMIILAGASTPIYAFSLFLPTIIKNMGDGKYSTTRSQLLSVPPYACAASLTVTVGYLADRSRQRGLYNIFVSMIAILGFGMLLGSAKPHMQYSGCFLGAMGTYPCIPNTVSWLSNNIEGVYKRGIILGFALGWGNINGIVSSNIFFKAPRFKAGHSVVLGYLSVFLFGGSMLMYFLLKRENAARRAGNRDYLTDGLSEKEAEMLGDKRPDFFYTL